MLHNLLRRENLPLSFEKKSLRINTTVAAIVEICNPLKVYLVGSAVSGHFDIDSDIDCVVVFETEMQSLRSWKLYGAVRKKLKWSLDLVNFWDEEFERKKNIGGMAFVAHKEGKLVYNRE
jgi:predicted nucleotidyltransferase